MNDVFRRVAGCACTTGVALLPAPLSAEMLIVPSAPTVWSDGSGPATASGGHPHHLRPIDLRAPLAKGFLPFIGFGAAGLFVLPALDGFATLNRGSAPLSRGLMSGAGNGNGNGNTGSNNGNGNQTNGNGNFGTGDGQGNGY